MTISEAQFYLTYYWYATILLNNSQIQGDRQLCALSYSRSIALDRRLKVTFGQFQMLYNKSQLLSYTRFYFAVPFIHKIMTPPTRRFSRTFSWYYYFKNTIILRNASTDSESPPIASICIYRCASHANFAHSIATTDLHVSDTQKISK